MFFFEGGPETLTRELLREAVAKHGKFYAILVDSNRTKLKVSLSLSLPHSDAEVAYIDFTKGDKTGYVRLTTEDGAKTLIDKLEDKTLKINDTEQVVVRLIEGDEEAEYLAKQVEQMIQRRGNNNANKGGRGRFQNRKRHAAQDTNDIPSKKSK